MRNRFIWTVGAAAAACAFCQPAAAQFFTNDLTDATAAAADFDVYMGSQSNSSWTYVSDGTSTDEDGNLNTVLTNGAVLNWVTADDDTARSYLATTYSNWMDHSWTAHIGVEAPSDEYPYIYFGLGDPTPKETYYNEPREEQSVFVSWGSGVKTAKIRVYTNTGATLYDSGAWQGDPGYDIWMTYNHIAKTISFAVDNWNGGRYSGTNVTTDAVSVEDYLTDTNNAHIFFGANAKVTFADFDVYEIDSATAPLTPGDAYTVISNMAVTVKWDEAGLAEGYNVMRSSESGSGYETIGSTDGLSFTDTTVAADETYYYVVAATNSIGVSDYSDEVTGVGLPYDIISDHTSTYGAGSSLDNDNLFDNDTDTYYDTTSPQGGWVGLDFGTNNAQQIMVIEYVLRDWTYAYSRATNATFEGANEADFSDAVLLHTVPTTAADNPTANSAAVTDTTSFRYIRLKAPDSYPLYAFAEMKFYTDEDLTSNGTPTEWLDAYYDVSGANPSNFADYAEADVSDTDGDGLLAYQEYQLGGDPTDASSPAAVDNLYAWPEEALKNVVYWDASAIADGSDGSGYVVYRSTDDSTYEAVAMVTSNQYTDTDVTAGVTYYYKASATNGSFEYESALSDSEFAVASEYDIFGVMNNSGAEVTRWFYELFDNNQDTFCDDNASGGYAGIDYGEGNSKQIYQISFWLRNDSWGSGDDGTLVIDGVTNSVTRAQNRSYGATFEGSNDSTNWTVLAAITNIAEQGAWNELTVTDTMVYRYVRYNSEPSGWNNYAMADVVFTSGDDFTSNGTPYSWLGSYGLVADGDYETADLSDTDEDGLPAWEEYVAGTDPTDAASVLELNSVISTASGYVVSWQSVAGKSYSIITNTSLTIPNQGTAVSGIIGEAGETSHTTTVGNADMMFFEVGVE